MELIDPMDQRFDPLLANLQGNILKGHGRDHTTHIFLEFKKGKEGEIKKWLSQLGKEHVTSFKKQLNERDLFKRNRVPGKLFTSVFISAAGYRQLGFADINSKFTDQAFLAGMKSRQAVLKDPPAGKWEKGFRNKIHAMVLLADDNINRMAVAAKEILGEINGFCKLCTIEYGNAIRNANQDGLEHFGYVDGVSQPLFLKDEVDEYMRYHGVDAKTGKNLHFNPAAAKELVLIADPYAPAENKKNAFGSLFVFRKLEQHVKGFKEAEEEIGKQLYKDDNDEEKRELAGAYLVGRFEDGTPVTLSDEEGLIGSGRFNNFNYDGDKEGNKCPFFAHIRKVNQRKQDAGNKETHNYIMARRGITYGHRNVDTATDPCPEQMPEGGVGLLFMSFQQSLEDQFEFIQKKWANDPSFPQKNTGIDPIIGQQEKKQSMLYRFPKEHGSAERSAPLSFEQFVSMKGGEYFFAPSLSFLQSLYTPD